MQLKKLFLLFPTFLILHSYSVQAQNTGTLKGLVTDASDKSTIIGATVFDVNDRTHGTVTDVNGNYDLKLVAGKHKMVCSFISMKTDTFSVYIDSSKVTVHNIVMESAATQLQTMVVSAGKYERKLEEITVSMEVIKPSLIENKNATNVKGALEQTPGLNILDGEPQIRGGSGFNFGIGSRVAILIDGLPALAGDGGKPEWNFIPVENVEQIEIIKGASSVTYGSSALSGSINIRTAYPKDKPETKASIYSGIYDAPSVPGTKWWTGTSNFSGANFLHSEKMGQLDLVIGGMGLYDHGFIGPPSFRPGGGPFNDTIDEKKVGERSGRFNFNLRYRPKNFTGLNYGLNGNFMRATNNVSLIWDDSTAGLYRAFPHTMTLQSQTMLYVDPFLNYHSSNGTEQSLRTRYFYTKNGVENKETSAAANPTTETNVIYVEYQIAKNLEKLGGIHFTGGVITNQVYTHSGITYAGISPNNHLQNFAAFGQFDKKIWKVLNLSIGFREEYFKVNDQPSDAKPVIRTGLNLQMAKATFLRYSFGQGYRYPSITEKYVRNAIGGLPIYPNTVLNPESSWNTEIGIKQGFKIKNFVGFFDAAAFWQQYYNTIEFTFGAWDKGVDQYGDPTVATGFKYLNTGKTSVKGAEISLTGQGYITKNLRMDVLFGYTYVLPQSQEPTKIYITDSSYRQLTYNVSSTDSTNNILKYRFQHLPKIDVQLAYKRFSIGGSWRYYSYIQNIDKTFYYFEDIIHSGLRGYREAHKSGTQIVDARIGVEVTKNFKMAFVVNNVFNLSYSLRPLKIESPRTFALRLSVNF